MKLNYKIWLLNDNGRVFGEGPYRLLKGIQATGSLWDAAARMGMAYSHARLLIKGCERNLGFALTLKKRGGGSVGGSEVTEKAGELMRAYKSLRGEMATVIGEAYKKHFGESIKVEYYAVLPQRRSAQYNREMAIASQPHEEDQTFPPELHSEN